MSLLPAHPIYDHSHVPHLRPQLGAAVTVSLVDFLGHIRLDVIPMIHLPCHLQAISTLLRIPPNRQLVTELLGVGDELLEKGARKASNVFDAIVHHLSLHAVHTNAFALIPAAAGVDDEIVGRDTIVAFEALELLAIVCGRVEEQVCVVRWDPRGHGLLGPAGLLVFLPISFLAFIRLNSRAASCRRYRSYRDSLPPCTLSCC
jgi:hypothetical protein